MTKSHRNITIVAAVARGGAIGRRGDLLFHLRGDLRHFKELTKGATVVMGRKTFDSLPKGALPERRNIVVTRRSGFSAPGAEAAGSLEAALEMAGTGDIYIIGGGEIYRQAMSVAVRLAITEVEAEAPDADTFFPPIDPNLWTVSAVTSPDSPDPSGISYRFVTYLPAHRP